jgi:hypothetical protein
MRKKKFSYLCEFKFVLADFGCTALLHDMHNDIVNPHDWL